MVALRKFFSALRLMAIINATLDPGVCNFFAERDYMDI